MRRNVRANLTARPHGPMHGLTVAPSFWRSIYAGIQTLSVQMTHSEQRHRRSQKFTRITDDHDHCTNLNMEKTTLGEIEKWCGENWRCAEQSGSYSAKRVKKRKCKKNGGVERHVGDSCGEWEGKGRKGTNGGKEGEGEALKKGETNGGEKSKMGSKKKLNREKKASKRRSDQCLDMISD